MTNPDSLSYRDLRKARTALKRKLKDCRKHHRPSDRVLMQIQNVTRLMLEIENKRRAA